RVVHVTEPWRCAPVGSWKVSSLWRVPSGRGSRQSPTAGCRMQRRCTEGPRLAGRSPLNAATPPTVPRPGVPFGRFRGSARRTVSGIVTLNPALAFGCNAFKDSQGVIESGGTEVHLQEV